MPDTIKRVTGNFKGEGGLNLHYRGFIPESEPKAVLIIVHGLAEHIGRYEHLSAYFSARGFAVYGMDHRGHGRSEGLKGHVERFDRFLTDLRTFHGMVSGFHPGKMVFLIGHSAGAIIAANYAISHQGELAGLVLSATTVIPGAGISPAKILAARVLSFLAPKMRVGKLDAADVSRDPAVVEAYENDPLVYRGNITARFGAELMKGLANLPERATVLRLPVLIMSGTEDRISRPEGSRILYEKIGSSDKTLKMYEGLYHEVFNEPEQLQVFGDAAGWLETRLT